MALKGLPCPGQAPSSKPRWAGLAPFLLGPHLRRPAAIGRICPSTRDPALPCNITLNINTVGWTDRRGRDL
jgi:hypothetical protein